MGEDATVVLAAEDAITTPVLKAVASLQQLQAAIADIADAAKALPGATAAAAAGVNNVSAASNAGVIPHRAAHQALTMITGDMAALAGASPGASAGVRVLDSVMMSMMMTGGAVSLWFIGIVAAAAVVGTAFRNIADASKATDEELKKMTDSAVKAVAQLDYLNAAEKSVAGVGAAQLQEKVIRLKTQIADLTHQMRENTEAAQGMNTPINASGAATGGGGEGWQAMKNLYASVTGAADPLAASQLKLAANLRVLTQELTAAQTALGNMTQKSADYKSKVADLGNPLTTVAAGLEREARDAENLGKAFSGLGDISYEEMDKIVTKAQETGVGLDVLVQHVQKMRDLTMTAFTTMATGVGEVLGEMIATGTMDWKKFMLVIVDAVLSAVQTSIMALIALGQVMAAVAGPLGIPMAGISLGVGLGALVAVGVLRGAAHSFLGGTDSSAAGSTASTASSAAASTAGNTGVSGTAVSSAQQNVTNNIVVNLPVQALDLSSISDMQLKSLANRVGRVLAEAAGTGQLSLAGA